MSKIYSRFETEAAQKPYLLGAHTYMAYIRETPGFLRADLEGKIFAYDYRAQLACDFTTDRVV